LGDPPEVLPSEATEGTAERTVPADDLPVETALPLPVAPYGPCDVELRKRQRAWQQERARFEASKQHPPATEEGSR
jgi:hypothetical protein